MSVELEYLGGHPNISRTGTCAVSREGDRLVIKTGGVFSSSMVGIPVQNVTGLQLEKRDGRSLGKAVAGTVIGGALTGGIGALAGLAIGGRRHDQSVILMGVNIDGRQFTLAFHGDPRKYAQLGSLLR